MANINTYLQAILSAVYGEDVRGSIHDAIALINDVSEVVLSTGTAVTSATSSSTGFFEDSLYLNTNTYELWKCIGTDSWQSLGILKGDTGNGIDNIAKTSTAGLVDTYTITYTDGTTSTFDVTNGKDGTDGLDGSTWYKGTALTGTGTGITGFAGKANDFYLNATTGMVYVCTTTGTALTALWDYVLTLSGGGGSITVVNNLSSTSTTDALSAAMGKKLNDEKQPNLTPGYGVAIDSSTHEITANLKAGTNVTITPDSTDDSLVIASTGGSGGLLPRFSITSEAGSTVTVVNEDDITEVITPTSVASGLWECDIPHYGVWIVHSVLSGYGDQTYRQTVDDVKIYPINDLHFEFTINVTAPAGARIDISDGVESKSEVATGSSQAIVVHDKSTTYSVSAYLDGLSSPAQTVNTPATTGGSATVTINFGTITVNVDAEFVTAGTTVTCTKGGSSCTAKAAASTLTFRVPETGTWTVSTVMSGETYDEPANVTSLATPVTVSLAPYIVYGYHVNSATSDPANAVTYSGVTYGGKAVANAAYTPAHMDFTNDAWVWGDWTDEEFFMPRPVLLPQDYVNGTKIYLNPDNLTKDVDNNDVTDKLTGTTDGYNAMMEWGRDGKKIWYKIVPDSDPTSYTVYISNRKVDSDFHAWSFYGQDDKDTDEPSCEHFYTAIYNGYKDGNNALRSLSGKSILRSATGQNEIAYAKANNKNGETYAWYIEVFSDRILISLLTTLITKSLDSQGTIGNGNLQGNSESYLFTTGLGNTKGLFYGQNNNNTVVKCFGMENYWANQWRRTAGLNLSSGVELYKLIYGQETIGGTLKAAGYIETDSAPSNYHTGDTIATNLSNSPITKEKARDDGSLLPNTFGGTTSTYYCDSAWSATGSLFALFGGGCTVAAACGVWCVDLVGTLSAARWGYGASLSCKPLA